VFQPNRLRLRFVCAISRAAVHPSSLQHGVINYAEAASSGIGLIVAGNDTSGLPVQAPNHLSMDVSMLFQMYCFLCCYLCCFSHPLARRHRPRGGCLLRYWAHHCRQRHQRPGRVCTAGHAAAVPRSHAQVEAGAAAGKLQSRAVGCRRDVEVLSALLATLLLFPRVVEKLRQEQQQVSYSQELFAC
jgi:hypothetical protein